MAEFMLKSCILPVYKISLKLDHSNKLVEIHEVGVEDAKELTILSLSCPYLDKNT